MDIQEAASHLDIICRYGAGYQIDILRVLGCYPVSDGDSPQMLFVQFADAVQALPPRGRVHAMTVLFGDNNATAVNALTAEISKRQFHLGEIIDNGRAVRLADGAHSDRKGVEQALYLFRSMKLGQGHSYVCVEITPVSPVSHGANEQAIASCRSMLQGED